MFPTDSPWFTLVEMSIARIGYCIGRRNDAVWSAINDALNKMLSEIDGQVEWAERPLCDAIHNEASARFLERRGL
jgi:hypothetical protein